jgi:hypothetical protein
VALNAGKMLRDCARSPNVAKYYHLLTLLNSFCTCVVVLKLGLVADSCLNLLVLTYFLAMLSFQILTLLQMRS